MVFFLKNFFFFQPEDCGNPSCCGPAEIGGDVFDKVGEWCSFPMNYTSLQIGQASMFSFLFLLLPNRIFFLTTTKKTEQQHWEQEKQDSFGFSWDHNITVVQLKLSYDHFMVFRL